MGDTDEYCDTMENLVFGDKRPINLPPAECGENNICLNPYRNGCLKTLPEVAKNKLISNNCFAEGKNIFDKNSRIKDILSTSIYEKNHTLTFFSRNWMTWWQQIFIGQIFAEEILFQPTNVLVDSDKLDESITFDHSDGFYEEEMPTGPLYIATQSISSKTLYPGMKRSSEVGNEFCEKNKKKNKSCPKREPPCYQPCASIILEGWDSTMSRLETTSGFDSYTDH